MVKSKNSREEPYGMPIQLVSEPCINIAETWQQTLSKTIILGIV